MEKHRLDTMVNGWFVGLFDPTMIRTSEIEVACKRYKAGDSEPSHHHKIATELTLIVSGMVFMNGIIYSDDDIIKIFPGESTDFHAITDTITVVVKSPSVVGDKYVDNCTPR